MPADEWCTTYFGLWQHRNFNTISMLTALNDRQAIVQGVAPNVNIETGT